MATNEQVLRQIINILSVNLQRETKVGLLQGKMGMVILFYLYSRYTGDKRYEYFPDEYLDKIERYMSMRSVISIAEGLGGIGWGIDYMIKEGFIEADDDVLEDVDAEVAGEMNSEKFLKDVEAKLPLFSKGVYFLQRGNPGIVKESLLEVFNLIRMNPEINLPLTYINSIVYVALVSLKMKPQSESYDELLDYLYKIVADYKREKIDSHNYFLLKKNISLMNEYHASKWNVLVKGAHQLYDAHECYWIDFLFPEGERIPVDIEKTQSWLNSYLQNFDYENMSVYKGLTGVGLAIMSTKQQY